ncbi:hypothetical protein VTL71DRAFT_9974 [Oculimacula yallundae]|uniref:Uncharacterized protein n=1 Tax=Oculimacula yallundae TaxID=86028 RepID=A0ABR4BS01_9HELO
MSSSRDQYQPQISTILTTSYPTCALSGQPAFTVTTTYECTASKPIWALVRLWADYSGGIEIRDPQRNHRRIGGGSTLIADEWDEDALDLEDTSLVRLEPGQKFSTQYTVSVVPKADGLRNSDIRLMVPGNTYEITIKKQRWRWMFEDEMDKEMDIEERRTILKNRDVAEWKVDCLANFTAS